MKVLWLAIELRVITCLYVTKHHLFTQNSNLISRSINITRSLHVKRPTLSIITWLPGRAIKSPLLHPPELLKQNLALTWSHVLHVIKFTLLTTQVNHSIIILEFAHIKFQRFLRPLPPLYITKHPLILFSPNFASYLHIKTKFIRWDHYSVAPIFLREFNFANGDFFVCFAGLIFAIGETVYPHLPGGGGTPIYNTYRYVPLWRVWFSSSLIWDRI